jgi:hypothetical protein
MKTLKNYNKELETKCREVNLGRAIIKMDSKEMYNRIKQISETNYKILEEDINGPYRFGCI